MELGYINVDQLGDLLQEGDHLASLNYGGLRVEVLHWDGQDILAFVNPNDGGAAVVSPDGPDRDSGSIHDTARALT